MTDDDLLRPREVAEILGVSAATVGSWARTGVLKPAGRTPGGQRRFRRGDVLAHRDDIRRSAPAEAEAEADLVRLYEQGWPIRRVAAEFGLGYSKTRRILLKHSVLRTRRREARERKPPSW